MAPHNIALAYLLIFLLSFSGFCSAEVSLTLSPSPSGVGADGIETYLRTTDDNIRFAVSFPKNYIGQAVNLKLEIYQPGDYLYNKYTCAGVWIDNTYWSWYLNIDSFKGTATGKGGGLYSSSSYAKLTNVIFTGNRANASGGGIYNSISQSALFNVTFGGNQAVDSGGAMYIEQLSDLITYRVCVFCVL